MRDKAEIKRRCRTVLSGDAPMDAQAALLELAQQASGIEPDRYGEGALADRLEARVAQVLGKPAAVFMPTGKMAQLTALRVLTGQTGCRRVALHPRAHFEEHEARAYQELHGLTAAQLGGYDRLPRPADLDAIAEPVGVVALELPLRRLGCRLMPWDDLVGLVRKAQGRGAATYLDGARLWESQPFYGRPLSDIAALFDAVFVAFDKGLGALGGAALAGSAETIAEARLWMHRSGGRPFRMFPYLLSAERALETGPARIQAWCAKARSIAAALTGLPGVRVTPSPPHVNVMLLAVDGEPARAAEAVLDVAQATGVWLFDTVIDSLIQGVTVAEITVRDPALALPESEIRELIQRFAAALAARS